jgi:crossover junction endodeoxyribonuclease RuvC
VVERAPRRALAYIAHGTLRLAPGVALSTRLALLHAALLQVITEQVPDLAVVETPFVAASPRAALILGHARGVVLAALGQQGVRVLEVSPAEVKLAVTGSGNADKAQVQAMVQRLLSLDRAPARDAADALAAAISAAHAGAIPEIAGARRARSRRIAVVPAQAVPPAPSTALAALGNLRGRSPRFVLRRG